MVRGVMVAEVLDGLAECAEWVVVDTGFLFMAPRISPRDG